MQIHYMNNKFYYQRSDSLPGYIYLMEAEGFHGLVPGCYLRRCKIGLSRDPQMRLDTFHSNQPPCDIKIIRTIYVENMEAVETMIHKQFKHCNVKLKKSREWFDLNPVDFARVNWAFTKHSSHVVSLADFPIKLMVLGLSVLISIVFIGGSFTSQQPQQVKPFVRMLK